MRGPLLRQEGFASASTQLRLGTHILRVSATTAQRRDSRQAGVLRPAAPGQSPGAGILRVPATTASPKGSAGHSASTSHHSRMTEGPAKGGSASVSTQSYNKPVAFCERQPPLPHDRGIGKGGSASASTQSFNKPAAFCELPLPLLSAENRARRGFATTSIRSDA